MAIAVESVENRRFYLYLKQMECDFSEAYPPGAAERYLRIVNNPSPLIPSEMPVEIDPYLLACLSREIEGIRTPIFAHQK